MCLSCIGIPSCVTRASQRGFLVMQWMNFQGKTSQPAACWPASSGAVLSPARSCTLHSGSPVTCQGKAAESVASCSPSHWGKQPESVAPLPSQEVSLCKAHSFPLCHPWGWEKKKYQTTLPSTTASPSSILLKCAKTKGGLEEGSQLGKKSQAALQVCSLHTEYKDPF